MYNKYVTIHAKTNHIAHKIVFEIKATIIKYGLWTAAGKNLKSSSCSFGDMSQNVPGLPVLKFYSKRNETLLRTLHMKVPFMQNTWPHPQSQ